MKIRLATLTACVAAIALLSGCFGSAEKAPAPQPEPQPAQTQSAPEQAAEPAAAEPEGPYLYNLLEDQPAKAKAPPRPLKQPSSMASATGKAPYASSTTARTPSSSCWAKPKPMACMPTLRTANPPRSAPCTTARRPPLRRPPCAKPLKLNASARWPTNKSHLPA